MSKAFRERRKRELHAILGGKCVCGETNSDILQVDHVFNDGAEERRMFPKHDDLVLHQIRYAYTGRFKLLCANCNVLKEALRRRASKTGGLNAGSIDGAPSGQWGDYYSAQERVCKS